MKTMTIVAFGCGLLFAGVVGAQTLEEAAAQPYQDRPIAGVLSTSGTSSEVAPETVSSSVDTSVSASPAASSEYTVSRGDNLSAIARRLLGDPTRFWEIIRLNAVKYPSLVKNPNLILVGWKLKLPGATAVASAPSSSSTSPTPTTSRPDATSTSGATDGSATSAEVATTRPPSRAPVAPAGEQSTSAQVSAPSSSGPLFNESSRVLHIGDSHTVGVYGKAIDGKIRDTGAKVQTYGVAGSSPSWWLNGTTTRCGYYSKDDKGKVDAPADWRTPRQTPDFRKLIADFKPNVIVISLGANMLGASDAQIKRQVQSLLDVAKAAGTTIVWVGPPDGRESKKPTSKQTALYNSLKSAVGDQATFIDSRPYTDYPETGGDGVHYGGTEGTRIAKGWAQQVFDAAQNSRRP